MKTYGGVDVQIHVFLTSASLLCCFTPGERALNAHLIGGWVGPRNSLEVLEKRKIYPVENRTPKVQAVARPYNY
jgi:hypothetical protein